MATTIQSLIQSAAPGAIVTVPAGTYNVSGLVVPGNITLQASGSVTLAGNISVSGPQTVLKGFTFSGGTVDISGSSGGTIQNCVFNGGQSSINLDGARGALITNNAFHDVNGSVVTGWGLDQSTISGNKFYNCYQPIDLMFDNNQAQGRNITISENYFTGTQRMPVEVGPTDAYTSNLVVKGNWSENMHNVGVQSGYSTDVAYSIVPTNGVNTLIAGNYAMGLGSGIGIELAGSGEVTGNYADNFWYGVIVYNAGFKVHDNALVHQSIETVLNYSGLSGTIQNNQTTAAGFLMPQKPGTATLPLPAVTAALAHDTGTSAADHITSNPVLTGKGDANAVVHFTIDGKAIATTATADATGKWTFTPTGLADGSHSIMVSETNKAGTGNVSLAFTLDKTAPAITAALASSSTASNPVLTGKGDANAIVHFAIDGKADAGTATANSSGVWSYTPKGLTAGQHTVVASETDVAGNTGKASAAITVAGDAGVSTLTPTPTNNSSLVASDDNYKVDSGKSFYQAVRYFTWNDKGGDGALKVIAVDKTSDAGFSISWKDGDPLIYKSAAGYNGVDHFNYTVQDSAGHTAIGSVNMTVGTGVSSSTSTTTSTLMSTSSTPSTTSTSGTPSISSTNPVVAIDDNYKLDAGKTLYFNSRYLTSNDKGSDLNVVSVDAVSDRGVHVSWGPEGSSADGTTAYHAASTFHGDDHFNYKVVDANGHSDVGTVWIHVA